MEQNVDSRHGYSTHRVYDPGLAAEGPKLRLTEIATSSSSRLVDL